MNSLNLGFAFVLLSLAGCAHSPAPAPAPTPDIGEQAEIAHPESIRVLCALYSVGGPGASSCSSIVFVLEDAEGNEIARKNPNESGVLEFPVPAGKAFRVRPRVTGAWTIERIPPDDLRAGDNVRVILRR